MNTSEQRLIQAIRFRITFVGIALGRGLLAGGVWLALVASGSCAIRDRVTHIYGVVMDTNQNPVEGVQIEIEALRRWTLNQGDVLKIVLTDKDGKYSVTVEPEKRHSRVHIINRYFVDSKLNAKYESYYPMMNGQHISHCCPAAIGQKTEYNFTLLSR